MIADVSYRVPACVPEKKRTFEEMNAEHYPVMNGMSAVHALLSCWFSYGTGNKVCIRKRFTRRAGISREILTACGNETNGLPLSAAGSGANNSLVGLTRSFRKSVRTDNFSGH